ncbi:MAG: putative sporulation protein YtxC [Clostridia bacterium]|nr:putative sporulation protein YtxC [Clostridia bacterium]
MKSLCIKENNNEVLSFINDKLSKLDPSFVSIKNTKFKLYKNIIIHNKLDNTEAFYDKISSILTDTIIHFYEKKLLKRILEYNYFYFNSLEKKEIIEIAKSFIESDLITEEDNFFAVYSAVSDYIQKNKSLVLEGFVNFRLSNYMKNLDYIVDLSVNKFITDKEYLEFVNMLKLYITLTPPKSSLVHLVYFGGESILLDKDRNIIPLDDENLSTKYLSDISFSSNDYALNTLLNLPPRRLIIHLMDKNNCDEFINTLKLIFDNRYEICSSCELCKLYKIGFN